MTQLPIAAGVTNPDFCISLVWCRSLLNCNATAGSRFSELSVAPTYMNAFRSILVGPRADGLRVPWEHPRLHHFWTHYLDQVPGLVPPRDAWRGMVPLRLPLIIAA